MRETTLLLVKEKNIFYFFVGALFLNILSWFLWGFYLGFSGFHFWETSPFLGLFFLILNFALAVLCFEDLKVLSWFLAIFSLFIQFLILFQIYKEVMSIFLI